MLPLSQHRFSSRHPLGVGSCGSSLLEETAPAALGEMWVPEVWGGKGVKIPGVVALELCRWGRAELPSLGRRQQGAQLVLCTIKSVREQVYLCSVFFFPISQAKLALFLGAVGFVLFSFPPHPVLWSCIYPDSSIRTGSGCKSCNKCLSPQHSGCHDSYSTPFRFYGLIFRLKR